MEIVDIVLIAFVALFAVVGIFKGLITTLLGFFSGITSVVLAVIAAKPVSVLINKLVPVADMVSKLLSGFVNNYFAGIDFSGGTLTGAEIYEATKANFFVKVLKALFSSVFSEEVVYSSAEEVVTVLGGSIGVALSIIISTNLN